MKKVLIIKMGYSETLTPEITRKSSLGDVLRTTVILNYFLGCHVTWLVDEVARPLLEENPRIDVLLDWNLETYVRLMSEQFDIVVNLEKIPGICALANSITAHTKYGFHFNHNTGTAEAHKDTEKILDIATSPKAKRENGLVWQDHLANAIRETWTPEDYYILNKPNTEVKYDIGINHKVGEKWVDKAWPLDLWQSLAWYLENSGYKISWQEGCDSLHKYMEWINQCSCIITTDSLGLHIALGYRKRVLVLFGPSPSQEVFLYNTGHAVVSPTGKMEDIKVAKVLKEVECLNIIRMS